MSQDKRRCAHRFCNKEFVPKVPVQRYHREACRIAEGVCRNGELKAELALRRAHDAVNKQHLPSAFFDGTRLEAAIADIRFEMECDKHGRSGSREVVAARVRAIREAEGSGSAEALYGCLILAAAALGSWATRISGGARFRQERRATA